MKETEFKNWLESQGYSKKVQSDIVSRIKRLEKNIPNFNIDKEYKKNKCTELLNLMYKKNEHNFASIYGNNTYLPIGSFNMGVYRLAIKKYINFKKLS